MPMRRNREADTVQPLRLRQLREEGATLPPVQQAKEVSNVTTARAHVDTTTVVRYVAKVEAYWPCPTGGQYTAWVECEHLHDTRDAAEACQERLARAVRRDPARFNVGGNA